MYMLCKNNWEESNRHFIKGGVFLWETDEEVLINIAFAVIRHIQLWKGQMFNIAQQNNFSRIFELVYISA